MITILGIFSKPSLLLGCNIWICLIFFFKCCLMSSDVGLHIRDKLRAMREHGSILLYVFMSTETMRLVRMDSPGRPPRLSHSSWAMWVTCRVNDCYLCSTRSTYRCVPDNYKHAPCHTQTRVTYVQFSRSRYGTPLGQSGRLSLSHACDCIGAILWQSYFRARK